MTGEVINIKDAYSDPRFNRLVYILTKDQNILRHDDDNETPFNLFSLWLSIICFHFDFKGKLTKKRDISQSAFCVCRSLAKGR